MTILKVLLGVLVSAACLIAFLAMTDEYERARVAEPRQARVLEVREGVVRYEVYEPGSSWDEDGDGWIGPYRDEGVPAEAAAALSRATPSSSGADSSSSRSRLRPSSSSSGWGSGSSSRSGRSSRPSSSAAPCGARRPIPSGSSSSWPRRRAPPR
ncbi:MAG: hypothetical protein M5U28_37275 [Sandaracinaceae bacterium]|nr:hypothetical protein [Sandaracinaceae bacterium]